MARRLDESSKSRGVRATKAKAATTKTAKAAATKTAKAAATKTAKAAATKTAKAATQKAMRPSQVIMEMTTKDAWKFRAVFGSARSRQAPSRVKG